MDFNLWESLPEKDRTEFKSVINTFFNQTFILERKYNPHKEEMETNSQYRFIERNRSLFEGYLSMSGWQLVNDSTNGIFYIKNDNNNNYAKLGKMATMFFLTIRLVYEERQLVASRDNRTIIPLKELLEKMEVLKLLFKRPSKIEVKQSLIALKRFMLIDKLSSGDYDNETLILVYPTVTHLIGNDVLEEILKEFQSQDNSQPDTEENDEETVFVNAAV